MVERCTSSTCLFQATDIIHELESYGVEVAVHDPLASEKEALHEYDVALTRWDDLPVADAIILAVAHEEFLGRPLSNYQKEAHRLQSTWIV